MPDQTQVLPAVSEADAVADAVPEAEPEPLASIEGLNRVLDALVYHEGVEVREIRVGERVILVKADGQPLRIEVRPG